MHRSFTGEASTSSGAGTWQWGMTRFAEMRHWAKVGAKTVETGVGAAVVGAATVGSATRQGVGAVFGQVQPFPYVV